jgi:hypothetical protein
LEGRGRETEKSRKTYDNPQWENPYGVDQPSFSDSAMTLALWRFENGPGRTLGNTSRFGSNFCYLLSFIIQLVFFFHENK